MNTTTHPLTNNHKSRLKWFAWCGSTLILDDTEEMILKVCRTLIANGAHEATKPEAIVY